MVQCGSGIGLILYPPFLRFLLDVFALRGTLLIAGAIQLNILVIGALMRPIRKPKMANTEEISGHGKQVAVVTKEVNGDIPKEQCLLQKDSKQEDNKMQDFDTTVTTSEHFRGRRISLSTPNLFSKYKREPLAFPFFSNSSFHRQPGGSGRLRSILSHSNPKYEESFHKARAPDDAMEMYVSSFMLEQMATSPVAEVHGTITSLSDGDVSSMEPTPKAKCRCINPVHVLLVLAFGAGNVGMFVQYMTIPNFARETGMSKMTAAMVVSLIGAMDIVGKVAIGYLTDRLRLKPMKVLITCNLVIGIAGIICPLFLNQILVFCYATLFGLISGVNNTMVVPVMASEVGMQYLSTVIGIVWLVSGVGLVGGTALHGNYINFYPHSSYHKARRVHQTY